MAINLEKNKDSLLAAWKEIVDDKIRTDWALFGYEGHTFDLKLVSKGDGGIEEMMEDINSSKIMYAFCRVLDPKTSLPKFVLINWQGEAAPMERKGKCANHIRDVAHFFKGAHVTINARTEDDVDPDVVIDKVAKSTVSAYNFKERSGPLQDSLPVSSVYKRTIPTAEINPIERDKFWEKEEAEERKRLEEEKRKAEDTKKKLEEERRRRELEEAKAREERFKEHSKFVSLQDAKNTQNISKNVVSEKEKWERQMKEDKREEEERKRRSESMRKERKEEAQALIAQRTINARAIFEKNTAAGQMSSIVRSSAKAIPDSQVQDQHSASVTTMQSSQPEVISSQQLAKSLPRPDVIPQTPPGASPPSPSPEPQPAAVQQDFSYTRNLLKEGLPPRMDSDREEEEEQDWDNTNQTATSLEMTAEITDPLEALSQEQNFSDAFNQEHTYEEYNQAFPDAQFYTGQGLCARALYDYQAADETEISFDPDDIITHIEQIDEGWWQGMSPGGTYGLFPANYVELIK